MGCRAKLLGIKADADISMANTLEHRFKHKSAILKPAAIALVLFMSAAFPEQRVEAFEHQTDWYSRGIVRRQTINVMTAQQKRQKHSKRKKRKANGIPHRQKH